MNDVRCFDCLADFDARARRFAVLKKMRDVPPECQPEDRKFLETMGCDPVVVCDGCAPHYGDDAVEIESDVHAWA